MRARQCNNPVPKFGGNPCKGMSSSLMKSSTANNCITILTNEYRNKQCRPISNCSYRKNRKNIGVLISSIGQDAVKSHKADKPAFKLGLHCMPTKRHFNGVSLAGR